MEDEAVETSSQTGGRSELWPLFGLRLTTERLQLRLPTEDEALRLVQLPPDDLDVDPAWPAPAGSAHPLATAVLQWYWRALGEWKVEHWRLPLAVWWNGESIGMQELEADRFPALRSVETSSWLVKSARGKGLGKEMRAAVLTLAFDHLGAARAKSGAWDWNKSSLGVSRALGYVDNGWDFEDHGHQSGVMRSVMLEKADWDGEPWKTRVEGLESCLAWFGTA